MKKITTAGKKKVVIEALEDIKAHDIQAIDVRKITPIFDWVIVASADSGRQTKALARHVRDKLKEAGSAIIGTEGEESGEWILVDAGDVVAHVMQPAIRVFYNLEELWGDGKFEKVVNSSSPVKTTRKRKVKARAPVAKKKLAPAAKAKKRAVSPRKSA